MNENPISNIVDAWRERMKITDFDDLKTSNEAKEEYQAGMEAMIMSFFKDNQELAEFALDIWGTLTRVCKPTDSAELLDDFRKVLASMLVHRIFGDDIQVMVINAPE